jgi:hypothetical protein
LGLATNTFLFCLYISAAEAVLGTRSITSLCILNPCSPRIALRFECFESERCREVSTIEYLRADSISEQWLPCRFALFKFALETEEPMPPVISTDLYISSKLGIKATLLERIILEDGSESMFKTFLKPGELRSRKSFFVGVV